MTNALRILFALALAALAGCETASTAPRAVGRASPLADVLEPVAAPIPTMAPNVVDIAKVEVPPAPIFRATPHYPTDLREASIPGQVKVLFTVTTQGDVTDLLVVEANDIRFGDAAKRAIAQWRFRPALVRGAPVACRILVPITFELSD